MATLDPLAGLAAGLVVALAPGAGAAPVGPPAPGPTAVRAVQEQTVDPASHGRRARVAAARDLLRAVERARAPSAAERLAAARAAFDAALGAEALALIDAVLGAEPDHAGALALLRARRDDFVLELPLPPPPAVWELGEPALESVVRATFASGGRMPPAAREVAVWRLEDAAHPEFVHATAVSSLRDPRATTRAFAALVLRRLHPGAAVPALIERSLLDADADVRRESAAALALVGDPAVAAPAVRALSAQHPSLRLHAAEALGAMGYEQALAPLAHALLAAKPGSVQKPPRNHIFFGTQSAYVQDYDVEVATGASIADPVVNTLVSGAVLDVRVIGVSGGVASTAHRRALRTAIERLAGVELGSQRSDWRAWWEASPHNPANAPAPLTDGTVDGSP